MTESAGRAGGPAAGRGTFQCEGSEAGREETRPRFLTRLEGGSQPGMGLSTAYPRQEPRLRPQKEGTTLVREERGKQTPLALPRASLPPPPTLPTARVFANNAFPRPLAPSLLPSLTPSGTGGYHYVFSPERYCTTSEQRVSLSLFTIMTPTAP